MRRLPRLVARLVAAVLFVQVVAAPAHCLALVSAPAGLAAVICSAEGARTVHLGPDGQEMPAHEAGRGFCPACHALPQVTLPAPPAPPAPAWAASGRAWNPTAAEALPPPARAPPFAPRAPPAFG
ncbi:DUF2946 family protein [Roseomonas sp. HF4]|uniref:DUF2946 family protein n=1 Tax=Roseomonas sp. HF4 TaxID=2562313 RepID=UPI0010C06FB7|nr:DUF2946 family protein [Roseomonas sp. HF4]